MTETSSGTHWEREDWCKLADRLLDAAMAQATPGHARIVMPGESGGLGTDVDGLEGFARVGLLAGTRLVGERGEALYKLASWWAKGVATGVDPKSDERWLRPSEHRQAVVEASSLALLLHFTKPWIWEHLSPQTREQALSLIHI